MATLLSPGVSISVTDESYYASTGAGTVPLIVIATAENKSSSDNAGIAAYTTPATAGEVYGITSQRELLLKYGNPTFYTSSGTPLNGYELNEYGLEAARSFLGFSNRAYIIRADIDLDALAPSATAPVLPPADGTYWLDTDATTWGVKRYINGNWVLQPVKVPAAKDISASNLPVQAYGLDFDLAVVYTDNTGATLDRIRICERRSGVWFVIGEQGWVNNTASDFQIATHLTIPVQRSNGSALQNNDLYLQTTTPNQGTSIVMNIFNSASGQWTQEDVTNSMFSVDAYNHYAQAGGPVDGDLWADFDETPIGEIQMRRWDNGAAVGTEYSFITGVVADPIDTFNIAPHINQVTPAMYISINDSGNSTGDYIPVYFTTDSDNDGFASLADAVADINNSVSSALDVNGYPYELRAEIDSNNRILFTQPDGYQVKFFTGGISGWTPATIGIGEFGTSTGGTTPVPASTPGYSAWELLSYVAYSDSPSDTAVDGTLWYDNVISLDNLDILINTGSSWTTFSGDVNIAVLAPSTRSDGTSLLVDDVWISTDNLELYPEIYKWTGTAWARVDDTDQETSAGILFGDFRSAPGSAIYSDAPNPLLYPAGILAWNMSASGGVVKQWDANNSRWVTVSGLKVDGSPYMLRKAQRRMVVRAMQAAVSNNLDIRNESLDFNLIAAPGYPELIDEMVSLNVDRKETAFILADSPMRLAADVTSTTNWATNAANAAENGEDGLLTHYPYMAVYYPSGRTTAIDGTNIVVPASHMTLRTLAYNDQVAYPWFAPAGYQRGIVTNATSVGYVDAETSEFQPVSLSEGQRDALYVNNVNPIANFAGRGIVVFGQKTLNPVSSALDRVNVARLIVYIRTVLDEAVRPFLFEPNDEATRQNAKTVVDRFLGQLVVNRALYDFITVCDTSNNTPDRIDRNELWIDIAIQPVKAVEFIYVPIRIQNTIGTAIGTTA